MTESNQTCSLQWQNNCNESIEKIVVKKAKPEDSLTFEQAMQQLEQLIETMEQGDLSLDASLEAFEKGVQLTRICQQVLKEAEQKVQILSQNTPDAELEPFERDS